MLFVLKSYLTIELYLFFDIVVSLKYMPPHMPNILMLYLNEETAPSLIILSYIFSCEKLLFAALNVLKQASIEPYHNRLIYFLQCFGCSNLIPRVIVSLVTYDSAAFYYIFLQNFKIAENYVVDKQFLDCCEFYMSEHYKLSSEDIEVILELSKNVNQMFDYSIFKEKLEHYKLFLNI